MFTWLLEAVLVMVRVGAHPVTVTIVASPLVCESVWSESTEAVLDSWPQVFGVVAWMVTTTSSGPLGALSLAASVPTVQVITLPVALLVQAVSPAVPGWRWRLGSRLVGGSGGRPWRTTRLAALSVAASVPTVQVITLPVALLVQAVSPAVPGSTL